MNPSSKILVVDPHPLMRRMFRYILRRIGFDNVVEDEDGPAALFRLQHEPIALVIAASDMPQLSGLDLLAAVRANAILHAIPVILTSIQATQEGARIAMQAGANGFIAPPIMATVLEQKLQELMLLPATLPPYGTANTAQPV